MSEAEEAEGKFGGLFLIALLVCMLAVTVATCLYVPKASAALDRIAAALEARCP